MSSPTAHESVFRAWLAEYGGIIAKVTRSYAHSVPEAEDLRQEILLQLWTSMPSFRQESSPSTWIYRVCLNTAMSWLRGDGRRRRRIEPRADLSEMPEPSASPADAAGSKDLLDQLYGAIHAMPEFDRALVLLTLDGFPYRDIADITGITENHVGVALTRARKRLAELLKGATHELE